MRRDLIALHLERALRDALDAPALRLIELRGERPASDAQRQPWIPVKYGRVDAEDWVGVVQASARFEPSPGAAAQSLRLVVKVNPREGLARTLIPWIVERQGIALDRPYWTYRGAAESDHTGAREQMIYGLAQDLPALRRVLPRYWGGAHDAASGEHALFLEYIPDLGRLDASGALADWSDDAIDAALRAIAGFHAAFWDVAPERAAWAGPRRATDDMLADAPLWHGLLDDARRRFPEIVTDKIWRRRYALIDTLAHWHPVKDRLPATLVHNDFNQRNVGFRPDLVILDWELVERNTALRDVVEMLTFVLPATAGRRQIDRHVAAHLDALAAAGIGGIDRDHWVEAFRCELKVEAIDRVGLQLLFAAQFPLPYIARINATIERLSDLYG